MYLRLCFYHMCFAELPASAQDSFVTSSKIYASNICFTYKIRGTRTVSSPGTASLVCGPTLWCLVFCAPSGLFHRDPKLTILTRTWYRLDSYILTSKYSSIYRDWQKTRHRDADGNSLNRRAG